MKLWKIRLFLIIYLIVCILFYKKVDKIIEVMKVKVMCEFEIFEFFFVIKVNEFGFEIYLENGGFLLLFLVLLLLKIIY